MRPEPKGTAGFSLAEALVALAIAAFLAGVLTRFVSDTRANATRIRQEVTMGILSDSLIQRLDGHDVRPGRTDGRSGALRWHIDIAPIAFSVRALSVSEAKPDAAGAAPTQLGLTGLTSVSSQSNVKPKPKPRTTWNPYYVIAVVTAPSGRTYAIDTIRIGQQRAKQTPADAASQ